MSYSILICAWMLMLMGIANASQHANHHKHQHARREVPSTASFLSGSILPSQLPEDLASDFTGLYENEKHTDTANNAIVARQVSVSLSTSSARATVAAELGNQGNVDDDSDADASPADSDSDSDEDYDAFGTAFSPVTPSPISLTSIDSAKAAPALDRRAAFGAAVQRLAESWNLPGRRALAPNTPTVSGIVSSATTTADESDFENDESATLDADSGSGTESQSDTEEVAASSNTLSATSEPLLTRLASVVRRSVEAVPRATFATEASTEASAPNDASEFDTKNDHGDSQADSDSDFDSDDEDYDIASRFASVYSSLRARQSSADNAPTSV